MSDHNDLAAFLDEAWLCLEHGVTDKDAGARHPAFATVSPVGWPEVRTVVLRAADRATAQVEAHTDPASAKVQALRCSPFAELMVWEPIALLQIRMAVSVEILMGAAVTERWARIPSDARSAYGTQPPPGSPIDAPFDYEKPGQQSGFAVLICPVQRIDLVQLGDRHRRATFSIEDAWQGNWCAP